MLCEIEPFFVMSPDKTKVSPLIKIVKQRTTSSLQLKPLKIEQNDNMRTELIDIFERECDQMLSPVSYKS